MRFAIVVIALALAGCLEREPEAALPAAPDIVATPESFEEALVRFAGDGPALVFDVTWNGTGDVGLAFVRDAPQFVRCSIVLEYSFAYDGDYGGYLRTRDSGGGGTSWGSRGPVVVGPASLVEAEMGEGTYAGRSSSTGESWGRELHILAIENLHWWDNEYANTTFHLRSECDVPHEIVSVRGSQEAIVLTGGELESLAGGRSTVELRLGSTWSGSLSAPGLMGSMWGGVASIFTLEDASGSRTWSQPQADETYAIMEVAAGEIVLDVPVTDAFGGVVFFAAPELLGNGNSPPPSDV